MVKRQAWTVGTDQDSTLFAGPFRSNVASFLERHGVNLELAQPAVTAWTVSVVLGAKKCLLYVYREGVTEVPPVCDQCRIIGRPQG